jgi:HAD superfamily hydrolase (TIGR01509 family)
MTAPSLVIFDCDGVLVDSEPLALRVLTETLAGAGLAMTEGEAQARFLGRSLAAVVAEVREAHGVDLGDAALAAMRARLHALFRAELKPIPGVGAAIDALPCPTCVASSSQPERIRLSLEVTGLLPRLEGRLFSATMVSRGKPAPDLFLFAAAQLGAAPAACAVVEDSPAGVVAARAAGMTALGFTGGGHARAPEHAAALVDAGAAVVFQDMARLRDLIAAA